MEITPTIDRLTSLLYQIESYFNGADEASLREPYTIGKWSRKQILGHLIDSAVNNLTRFTEIGYQPQPYAYREYNQAELVQINNYQEMNTTELVKLFLSLNKQIARIMAAASRDRLDLKVQFPDGTSGNLRFLMTDYPEHMAYHVNQIING